MFINVIELLDAVVLQERQDKDVGGKPTRNNHIQHRRGFLGSLQSYRACLKVGKMTKYFCGNHLFSFKT